MKTHYFDNASTTPVDQRVRNRMFEYLTDEGIFGNPSSNTHQFGWFASEAVEVAREEVATTIGADPREIVWTSGATESNNLAIRGTVQALAEKSCRNRIITLGTEHKAVLDTCERLTGIDLVVLDPKPDGQINWEALDNVLNEKTLIVSVMLVNNETGVVQEIQEIAKRAHGVGALMHTDLAQSVGKMPVDVTELAVDLGSLSAHKAHGPKGIGALYVRRSPDVVIAEQQHGGYHERGMRSGTLPTHQIVGMGEAYRLVRDEMISDLDRIAEYRVRLEATLASLGNISINGFGVPHILNASFHGLSAEPLISAMPRIAVSNGSACNSTSLQPSHVLKSMGLNRQDGLSSLRISFGRTTSTYDVQVLIDSLTEAVEGLRK